MYGTVIYPGSFNPVHCGHVAIAQYLASGGLCDLVWIMPSPLNPLKEPGMLAPEEHRLKMAAIAAAEADRGGRIGVSDFEFSLPRPSYTIDTLRALEERHPSTVFSLLIGSDALEDMGRWKEHEALLSCYKVLVYPREGFSGGIFRDRVVWLDGAPSMDISSTDIRRRLRTGRSVAKLLSPGVEQYIREHKLWIR